MQIEIGRTPAAPRRAPPGITSTASPAQTGSWPSARHRGRRWSCSDADCA